MSIYFNVAPRFTPGSPAQVNEDTALRVVSEEVRAYNRREYDPTTELDRDKALKGIVESRNERADCWIVTDMILNTRFVRLFPQHRTYDVRMHRRIARLKQKYNLEVE